MFFTKKQVVAIVDEVLVRAKQAGNDIQSKSGKELYKAYDESVKIRNLIKRKPDKPDRTDKED